VAATCLSPAAPRGTPQSRADVSRPSLCDAVTPFKPSVIRPIGWSPHQASFAQPSAASEARLHLGPSHAGMVTPFAIMISQPLFSAQWAASTDAMAPPPPRQLWVLNWGGRGAMCAAEPVFSHDRGRKIGPLVFWATSVDELGHALDAARSCELRGPKEAEEGRGLNVEYEQCQGGVKQASFEETPLLPPSRRFSGMYVLLPRLFL
jgi:hypothetical protein